MGYQLNSLGNLPLTEEVSLYIFVINGQFKGKHYMELEQNFSKIAKAIGSNSVIAVGLSEAAWTDELCKKYFGKNYEEMHRLLPALLLTDTHPDQLDDESMRLIIPLKKAENNFGSLQTFFRELSEFALNRDPAFLNNFEDEKIWLKEVNKIVEIKPNFLGFGINFNALIDKLTKD